MKGGRNLLDNLNNRFVFFYFACVKKMLEDKQKLYDPLFYILKELVMFSGRDRSRKFKHLLRQTSYLLCTQLIKTYIQSRFCLCCLILIGMVLFIAFYIVLHRMKIESLPAVCLFLSNLSCSSEVKVSNASQFRCQIPFFSFLGRKKKGHTMLLFFKKHLLYTSTYMHRNDIFAQIAFFCFKYYVTLSIP